MQEIRTASRRARMRLKAPHLLWLAVALLLSGGPVLAQRSQQTPEARIVVTGEGSVSVAPDHAEVRIGVTTRTRTVKEGVDTNSRTMAAIMAALRDAGVADKDIQTARFSIQPVYASEVSRNEPKLSGYSVANHVNVTIRDIGKVGDLLDRVVAAGANDIGNVAFLVSDVSKALDRAREAAIADARRKAEVYAQASGVQLGRVEWITEDGGVGRPVPMMARTAAAPVPIATGEDTLRVRVSVGFDMAR